MFAAGVVLMVGIMVALFLRGAWRGDSGKAETESPSFGQVVRGRGVLGLSWSLYVFLLIWATGTPLETIGLIRIRPLDLIAGVALGVGLWLSLVGLTWILAARGIEFSESRNSVARLMDTEDKYHWNVVIGVVYPLVAFGEELLFRGAFIGGLHAAWGLPIWVLILVSGILYGLPQLPSDAFSFLRVSAIGWALAGGWVLVGSLVVPILAHYIVNVLLLVTRVRWPGLTPFR